MQQKQHPQRKNPVQGKSAGQDRGDRPDRQANQPDRSDDFPGKAPDIYAGRDRAPASGRTPEDRRDATRRRS